MVGRGANQTRALSNQTRALSNQTRALSVYGVECISRLELAPALCARRAPWPRRQQLPGGVGLVHTPPNARPRQLGSPGRRSVNRHLLNGSPRARALPFRPQAQKCVSQERTFRPTGDEIELREICADLALQLAELLSAKGLQASS